MILARLEKKFTGSTLARIAVEVLEEKDIDLLIKSGKVDWSEAAEGEDLPIIWALENREKIGENLAAVNKMNLEGDKSSDVNIICGEKTLRVHKAFLKAKSPVFEAGLRSGMKEEAEGVIRITDISPDTITAMIHYIYTGELGCEDLDILDVAEAAEKYILPGWVEELCSNLRAQEVSEEMVADMVVAGSGYPGARRLIEVAVTKIKARKEIITSKEFRKKFHDDCLLDLIQEII